MSAWTKLRDKIVAKICKALGVSTAGAGEGEACERNRAREEPEAAPAPSSAPPAWDKCVHASCWAGANAKRRMMNILSPGFSDAKFTEYAAWMKSRGCDAAHVFLVNQADGEGAGQNCATKPEHAKLAKKRIEALRKDGFAVVPWVIADDSAEWLKDLFAHPEERVKALADAGLFEQASYVVIGLEMDEAGSAGKSGWKAVAAAIRKHYNGKLGTHHASGNTFAYASLGEIVLGQLDPGCSASDIKKQIAAIKAKGKAAVGFEYARSPDRVKAQAALDAGAVGVGNW